MMDSELINLPDVLAEVRAAFDAYETALRRNQPSVLNEFFWDDPRTLRYGIAEHQEGYAAIRAWRQTAPAISETRRVRDTRIVTFGREMASVCTQFTTGESAQIGRQTQMWLKLAAGWKIVAAHVSLIDSPRPADRPYRR